MRESKVEDHLKKLAKKHGGSTRKVKWIARHGAPDRLVLLPGKFFFVELKRPGKDAEAHQTREHLALFRAGIRVYLADTIELVEALPWV